MTPKSTMMWHSHTRTPWDSAEMTAVGGVAKMDIKPVNTIAFYDPSWMTKDNKTGIHQLPLMWKPHTRHPG